MIPSIGLAVLAGGKSSRMGVNKAKQMIGNQTLIEHVLSITTTITFGATTLITNTPQDYQHLNIPTVSDIYQNQGAVGGIHSALHHMHTDYILVLACDMPFIQVDLIRLMIEIVQNDQYQVVVPTVQGYPQAVLALYHQKSLHIIEAAIQSGQRKLKSIITSLSPRYMIDETQWQPYDPNGVSFININTPVDLARARNQRQNLVGGQMSD